MKTAKEILEETTKGCGIVSEQFIIKAMEAYHAQFTPSLDKPSRTAEEIAYEINFGGHFKAKLIVANNKIEVEAAVNGYGNGVSLSDIHVIKLSETPSIANEEDPDFDNIFKDAYGYKEYKPYYIFGFKKAISHSHELGKKGVVDNEQRSADWRTNNLGKKEVSDEPCEHEYSDGTGTGYNVCKKCGDLN